MTSSGGPPPRSAHRLGALTTYELAGGDVARVALLPVGSVEPHGPHLPLDTDTVLAETNAARAAAKLEALGLRAYVAPSIPYGVTDFAEGFAGAIGVDAPALVAFVRGVVARLLKDGFAHVCVVNHHLEPAQDQALREALATFAAGEASLACPLTRRWGRTLSEEFKRGECHAGRYETSLLLAAGGHVRPSFAELPEVPVSLSRGIREGQRTFRAIGMDAAYAGAPAAATREEGELLHEKLAEMIVIEVQEALAQNTARRAAPVLPGDAPGERTPS